MTGWRAWVTGSVTAVRISRSVCALTAAGLAIAAALVIATLVTDRPFGSAGFLLIPSIPGVIAGQAWGIAVLSARRPAGQSGWKRRSRGIGGVPDRDPRRFFFEGLPIPQANALIAVFFLGWTAAIASFPSLTSGGPTSPAPGCPYRLNNHRNYKCVSHATYVHVGAAEQRFAAAVIAGFFAIQLGISAAELARRRAAKSE